MANVNSISSTSKQVQVVLVPSAEFSLTRSGTTITVEANEANAVGWHWDFGDGTTATGRMTTHTYANLTTAEESLVQLTVEASNGCSNSGYDYISDQETNIYLPIIIK